VGMEGWIHVKWAPLTWSDLCSVRQFMQYLASRGGRLWSRPPFMPRPQMTHVMALPIRLIRRKGKCYWPSTAEAVR